MDFIVLRKWEGVIRGSVATLAEGAIIDAGHYDVPALKASGLRVVAFSAALAAKRWLTDCPTRPHRNLPGSWRSE